MFNSLSILTSWDVFAHWGGYPTLVWVDGSSMPQRISKGHVFFLLQATGDRSDLFFLIFKRIIARCWNAHHYQWLSTAEFKSKAAALNGQYLMNFLMAMTDENAGNFKSQIEILSVKLSGKAEARNTGVLDCGEKLRCWQCHDCQQPKSNNFSGHTIVDIMTFFSSHRTASIKARIQWNKKQRGNQVTSESTYCHAVGKLPISDWPAAGDRLSQQPAFCSIFAFCIDPGRE